ncbi:MAG: aspartate aminotransferase family protein [Bacteroidetes bacterium]|nr:aspartate aminotransferase family protein [Bacteroidota bacterium]MBU2585509.1 aspartate aminotransferase family protein [Bacteroidota bacterium]
MSDQNVKQLSVSEITAKYTYGTWRYQKNWKPLHVVDAEGCYFTDSSGKKYLDLSSQLMCVSLGHKNQAVIKSIEEQARKLPYIAPGFATDVRVELSELLLKVLPKGLEKFYFSTSGTEANEAAIKIARMYTGKYKIISRYNSYHGSTAASIAATGDPRRWAVEPSGKIDGVIFAPECNCYRCPLKHNYPDCNTACVEYIEHMIKNEGNVAAILIEPVVGTNGILIPPDEYLPRLRQICDDNNVLLIVDEVMSGWGRTGKWFAVDHWNIVPDILTTAKGITSAYVPLGLTATTMKIADYFNDHYFSHGHTYEAHPLTLAPAVAAINELKKNDLINRSKEMGEYLLSLLNKLKEKHPSVGDVRVIGLFAALEIVKNRKTKEPFSSKLDKVSGNPMLVDKIALELMKKGIFVQTWISHFIIAPPLIISKEEIDYAITEFDEALKIADAEINDN